MIEYILFYIVVTFGAILSFFNLENELKKHLYLFISLLFFILIGFRYCGYDYYTYNNVFDIIKRGDEVVGIEFGFSKLCQFSGTFRQLLIVAAFLTVYLHSKFIYKLSEKPLFSLFLLSGTLLLPTFMGQIRQGLAMGFVAFAFYFLIDKRYHLYFLFVFLSILFHFSALISLLFLVIPNKIKSLKYYCITILLSLFAFQFLQPVFLRIISHFESVVYLDKLLEYSNNDDKKIGFNSAIVIRIFVLFLGYYSRNLIESRYFSKMLNIYHYSIIIYLILGPIIPQFGGRGALYFAYFDLILIPAIMVAFKGYKRILISSIFIILTFSRILQFFIDDFNYDLYVPYLKYIN